MGNYRESGEVLFMKNGMKKTAAVVMAAMLMGPGAVVPAAEDMGIFSQTAIVAEAASVGKGTGLKSKTLSNSEIQLNWSKVKGASGYTVYMRKNGKYNKLGDCKGTSYTVKKLPNATSVTAIYAGTIRSKRSALFMFLLRQRFRSRIKALCLIIQAAWKTPTSSSISSISPMIFRIPFSSFPMRLKPFPLSKATARRKASTPQTIPHLYRTLHCTTIWEI